MKRSVMKKQNWILLGSSFGLMYLGFILMRLVTRNYDGVLAFVTIIMAIAGIIGAVLSLSLDFSTEEENQGQK